MGTNTEASYADAWIESFSGVLGFSSASFFGTSVRVTSTTVCNCFFFAAVAYSSRETHNGTSRLHVTKK